MSDVGTLADLDVGDEVILREPYTGLHVSTVARKTDSNIWLPDGRRFSVKRGWMAGGGHWSPMIHVPTEALLAEARDDKARRAAIYAHRLLTKKVESIRIIKGMDAGAIQSLRIACVRARSILNEVTKEETQA